MTFSITRLRSERGNGTTPIDVPAPRLSWALADAPSEQDAYEIELTLGDSAPVTTGYIRGSDSTFVTWPFEPLQSRQIARIRVRARASSGEATDWSDDLAIEMTLLERSDWRSGFVSPSTTADRTGARRAYLLRADFDIDLDTVTRARVYSTAHGVYELELNGRPVHRDLLSPGWTSYSHRLRAQAFDVLPKLANGRNAIGVWLADGWYRGRLGFNGGRWDNYGTDIALLLQLELTHADGTVEHVPLQDEWAFSEAPITSAGLYEGEAHDATLERAGWSSADYDDSAWGTPKLLPLGSDGAVIEAPTGPPVAVTDTLQPLSTERRDNGRIRLDFGQNIAGRLRIRLSGDAGSTISLHHAEVLEDDELAIRPLRHAPSVDHYTFAGRGVEEWAPRFTYHGFRYAEVEGWSGELADFDVVAEVVHTDMKRVGWFDSSHALLNKLHENTVWGMRGNFVDLPTDCPQRDERLGWTGDIQVFAPAATFLYESSGTLAGWMKDLAAEQSPSGAVPNFVPWIECGFPHEPSAAWGDAAVIVPWVIYERTADVQILIDQFPSMCAWVDLLEEKSGGTGLWDTGFQLGDWLDPAAPPEAPDKSQTDVYLVATAYFARSAELLAKAATVIGNAAAAEKYAAIHAKVVRAFQAEFVSATGRVVSDTTSALSLAIVFDLLGDAAHQRRAGARLVELVKQGDHRIQTGFVGTPIVCDALVLAGAPDTAYHLLLQEGFPSWLYPVTMGATTIWERWDSMLPNGDINPGEMTSFNHYALGAVVDFMHRVVAGLAPAAPGYKKILIKPIPGGGLTHASARHITPLGAAEVAWRRDGTTLTVEVTVPMGASARVELPSDGWQVVEIAGGSHTFVVDFRPAGDDVERPTLQNPHDQPLLV